MSPIGISIRQSNKKNYIGLKEIADQLNVDRATYANWENQMFDTKSQYIPKLADIFAVEIKELFKEEKTFHISNSTFNDSAGILVFNLSDRKIA